MKRKNGKRYNEDYKEKQKDENDGTAAVVWGNFKMVGEDGKVYLKVINFPVPENCGVVGESMWVEVMEGNDNKGIGLLNNIPRHCEEVKVNDIVIYEGGTDERKPHFAGKYNVESSDDDE